jgi:NADH-quinone oxidoreductase subunit N
MGFALLYGAAGTTSLTGISQMMTLGVLETGATEAAQGVRIYELGPMFIAGLALSIIGISFKIAAVPMHFYAADVYQGAAAPVAAYLAFAPKAAGFFALASLLSAVTWFTPTEGAAATLPAAVGVLLWVMAALTMTIGNVLALQQRSAKRMLAYSSIAHSGYMLVALLAGPGATPASDGLGAVLFYLLVYGVTNAGAFAVIGALEKRSATGEMVEAENLDDLRGLCRSHPLLGWSLVISSLGLLGLPPLFGFWGKLPLFSAGLAAEEYVLVVILALNSAAAAFYYLRLAAAPLLESLDDHQTRPVEAGLPGRRVTAALSAAGAIVLVIFTAPLQVTTHRAAEDAYERITRGERFRDVIFRGQREVSQRDDERAEPVASAPSR